MRQWLSLMNGEPVTPAQVTSQQGESTGQKTTAGPAGSSGEIVQTVEMALDRLREIEKRTAEMERNLAVQQAILDDRLLRLETSWVLTGWNSIVARGHSILRSARTMLAASPLRALVRNPSVAKDPAFRADYAKWLAREEARQPSLEHARDILKTWTRRPAISIVLAVRHGRGLLQTLQSIQNQVYPHWEVCLALPEDFKDQLLPLLCEFQTNCGHVRYIVVSGLDDATALGAAAGLAAGEYLSFVDEASVLSPFALYSIAEAVQSGTFDLVYTDEDVVDAEGSPVRPIFKPDWSPDLLTSCMYLGRFLTVRREAFEQCNGLRPQFDDVHLHDLVLRLADAPVRVHHIRRVLYHSPDQAGAPSETATARAIEDAVVRREGITPQCLPGAGRSTFLIRSNRPSGDMTVVICSKSPELVRKCLASLRATTNRTVKDVIVIAHEESSQNASLRRTIQEAGATPVSFTGAFNFSAMNNLGADRAKTPNLLFLNDDVEATWPGWADVLSEQLSRAEIGIAGAVLWYPSRLLQHAGIVVGIADGVGHVGRYASSSELWPWLLVTRNVSAVTGACLAIRKELFQKLGGFDAAFPNNYNDVDLCFRVRALGLGVVCVPVPGLIHHECQSRRGIVRFEERYPFYKRWAEFLDRPDPYYSSSLAPTEEIALNLNRDSWHHGVLSPRAAG